MCFRRINLPKVNRIVDSIRYIYKFREDKKEYTSIEIKANDECFEQEFIFMQNEFITNVMIFRKDYLQGFEITTNLKRSYRFGLDNGEKIMLNQNLITIMV